MATFKKKINMPALFRALADLSEAHSTYEESFQLLDSIDLIGDDSGVRETNPRLTVECKFRHDLDCMTLDLGALYQKYGGNPLDFLSPGIAEQLKTIGKDQAESNDKVQIGEDVIDEREWDITISKCDQDYLPLERKLVYWVKAEIQRKDQKVFENVIGRRIALLNRLATIAESQMKHFLASNGQVSVSALIMCKLEGSNF